MEQNRKQFEAIVMSEIKDKNRTEARQNSCRSDSVRCLLSRHCLPLSCGGKLQELTREYKRTSSMMVNYTYIERRATRLWGLLNPVYNNHRFLLCAIIV